MKTLAIPFSLVLLVFPTGSAAQPLQLSGATIADLNAAMDEGVLTSERLVELYLARIAAYDDEGPRLNALLTVNRRALETARQLDRERRERGPRSPLHGIPVILKDNVDTHDMPTTAGSILLKGSIPPDDAFITRRLREAGAIILGKANMSELASGVQMSSIDGPMLNPHNLGRTPSGSSGGTGVAIAASYAQLGIGTDTGGSVRGPSTSNGIAGLKPTLGLLSRDGIVPLALSFDTAGPMARHVYDVAAMLGVMVGVDQADPATSTSAGRYETDYTRALDGGALAGARIGIARDFLGYDTEVDWIIGAALDRMREAGATVVDVRYPPWLLDAKAAFYQTIRFREFPVQMEAYLATLSPGYPRTLEEMAERAKRILAPMRDGGRPNPTRWSFFEQELAGGSLEDSEYAAMRDLGLPLVRDLIVGVLDDHDLDAIVYPTSPTRPGPAGVYRGSSAPNPAPSATNLANLSGLPDLIVPAGYTGDGLPVGISFLGREYSEARLLALGYAFEQATRVRRDPVHAPALPGETLRR
ncbi:MAG: glutamyl-tRNA amidotransferase [Gemmatimonadetes bacterium]|nr:glutamyl-tRNA amidotransferase [Gemmatimonadota bacterium]MYG23236.1 glutamyl-tRNA amidotransferase [Gemmatimonadota bacterium]MYJ38870.1 glutamyl-tRNA amidotransferase [Gemmatimonadota bacterium]